MNQGISHFISMAETIIEGEENFELFVVYVADYYKDIIFSSYLNWLEKNSNGKVKFCYLLGEESRVGCRHGNVTSSLIKSLLAPPYSVFASGSNELIDRLNLHLAKLGISDSDIHMRRPFVYATPEDLSGKPYAKLKPFTITVKSADITYPPIEIEKGDTLMVAMEKAGLNVPGKCMNGGCGVCRSRLLEGKVELMAGEDWKPVEEKYSVIHPCVCYPLTDVTIEIPIKRDEI